MFLLAIRGIDLAIFGTMGTLWIVGSLVIYFVWRWVIRQERAAGIGRRPPVVRNLGRTAITPALDRLAEAK
jgi:hypothetical protein